MSTTIRIKTDVAAYSTSKARRGTRPLSTTIRIKTLTTKPEIVKLFIAYETIVHYNKD